MLPVNAHEPRFVPRHDSGFRIRYKFSEVGDKALLSQAGWIILKKVGDMAAKLEEIFGLPRGADGSAPCR
jgi:hypothetical protein